MPLCNSATGLLSCNLIHNIFFSLPLIFDNLFSFRSAQTDSKYKVRSFLFLIESILGLLMSWSIPSKACDVITVLFLLAYSRQGLESTDSWTVEVVWHSIEWSAPFANLTLTQIITSCYYFHVYISWFFIIILFSLFLWIEINFEVSSSSKDE